MSEQCDQLTKIKVKIEKDKQSVRIQVDDIKAGGEILQINVDEKRLKTPKFQFIIHQIHCKIFTPGLRRPLTMLVTRKRWQRRT